MSPSNTRVHPIVTIAASAVTVAALLAIAIMIGILPRPQPKVAAAPAEAAAQAPHGATRADVHATWAPANAATPQRAQQGTSAPAVRTPAPATQAPQTQSRPARPAATAPAVGSTQAPARPQSVAARTPAAAPVCQSCGTVTSVRTVQQQGEAGLIGPVAGGVIGGAVGSRIGSGSGKAIATIAGAAGGAAVGTEIERRARATTRYVVSVRMDTGATRTFDFTAAPGVESGDRVRVSGGTLVRA